MSGIVLFAAPWWVNLLILAPLVPYLLSRHRNIDIGTKRLVAAALFGIAFGFVEATVVVYLRAVMGLLPGYRGIAPAPFPDVFMSIESVREAATMIMLGAVAYLTARSARGKVVAFLWTFAFWDFVYYVSLYFTIGWPTSLTSSDILFLIPVPWISQVWFPLLISSLTIAVICLAQRQKINPKLPVEESSISHADGR